MKVFVHSKSKTLGPYELKEITEHLQKEVFSYEDLFCYDNQNWVKFYELPGFKFSYESEQRLQNIQQSSFGKHDLRLKGISKKEITKLDVETICKVKKYFGAKSYTKLSRNIFVSFDLELSFVLKISKFYESTGQYWFTLREKEFDLLSKGDRNEKRYFIFICPQHFSTFILNYETFNRLSCNINNKDGNFHIFIYPRGKNFFIGQPSKSNTEEITSLAVDLEANKTETEEIVSNDVSNPKKNDQVVAVQNLIAPSVDRSKPNDWIENPDTALFDETNKSLKRSKVVKLKFGTVINKKNSE
jgi:hypothetical protein